MRPRRLTKADSSGWTLWEQLAEGRPEFGNPAAFNSFIAQSWWESFTVTLKNPAFFDPMTRFSGNEPGTGGLVTFMDSNWLLSIVLAHQPHFPNQPADVQVFWGYSLFRTGSAISLRSRWPSAMAQRSCGNLRAPAVRSGDRRSANCIPCRMPYITSMFMPRKRGDRPLPVPGGRRTSRLSASCRDSR